MRPLLVVTYAFAPGVHIEGLRRGPNRASVATDQQPGFPGDIWRGIANGLEDPEVQQSSLGPGAAARPLFDDKAWDAEFEAKTFEQQADHLNAYHQQMEGLQANTTTFQQRYWINTKAWLGAAAKGPIFVIISPYQKMPGSKYGFVGEMSRSLGAMVVQIEGRFAPGSTPFGGVDGGFIPQANRLGLLSAENALRDYALLVSHLRDRFDPEWICPTMAIGTSLAGSYSAWLRYKFPHIIDMAVASGSPMIGYPGTSDGLRFSKVITETWRDASKSDWCVELVRAAFTYFYEADETTRCHRNFYQKVYNEAVYESYPPRGRIWRACWKAKTVKTLTLGLSPRRVAMALCGDDCANACQGTSAIAEPQEHRSMGLAERRQPSRPPPPPGDMWSYFSCTQMVSPIASNGRSDFFAPGTPWNAEWRAQACLRRFQVEPQKEGNYHADLFGWHRLSQLAASTSRILFAYGTYDAWTGFAISTQNVSDDLPVVMAKGGCHGSDLKTPISNDTPEMREARQKELAIVSSWVHRVQARSEPSQRAR